MRKNILEPASLMLGCIASLSILNPSPVQSIEAPQIQSNLQQNIEYQMPYIVTTSSAITPKSISILENTGQNIEIHFAKKMYATSNVNIRTEDNLKSDVVTVLKRGQSIKVFECQKNGWSRVLYKKQIRYIYTKYLSKTKPKNEVEDLGEYIEYIAPGGHHPKTFMDWDCITDTSSKQYQLKRSSYIGNYGIIMNGGRYCVALGSGFIKYVGTKFDLILANGTIIPCIAGDMKADQHTDSSNRITSHDGSIAEFIVNTSSLVSDARRMGDISYSCDSWNSEIAMIRVYK